MVVDVTENTPSLLHSVSMTGHPPQTLLGARSPGCEGGSVLVRVAIGRCFALLAQLARQSVQSNNCTPLLRNNHHRKRLSSSAMATTTTGKQKPQAMSIPGIPDDFFVVKKSGLSQAQALTAYLGGSAFQTIMDNPITAYRYGVFLPAVGCVVSLSEQRAGGLIGGVRPYCFSLACSIAFLTPVMPFLVANATKRIITQRTIQII